MPKAINIAFTFSPDLVQSFREVIQEELLESQDIANIFGVIETGVKNGKKIGFLKTNMGPILKTGTIGCKNTNSTVSGLSTYEKEVVLKSCYLRFEECADDTRDTMLRLTRQAFPAGQDLTSTEYYAVWQSVLAANVKRSVLWKALFDDTAADVIANGGKLTAGLDKTKFNTVDGVFKQLQAIYTADANRRVSIAANATATYALQDAITPAQCTEVFNALYRKADRRLKAATDKIYICTSSLLDGYREDMQLGKGVETLMDKQINGVTVTHINRIPIYDCNGLLDEFIRTNFDNGTKWDSPHRAILTSKSQLRLFFESNDMFETLDLFYDRYNNVNVTEAQDQIDVKLGVDFMFQVAI